tara:strand:- start:5498 stop:6460 length:963 start_codon:yes stop_codon:yes gene_type:complete
MKGSNTMKITKSDHYEEIFKRLEDAVRNPDQAVSWIRPWAEGSISRCAARSVGTGKAYRGINAMWFAMQGYTSPWWLTFKQAKALGGSVRKGEKSTVGCFYRVVEKKDKTTGESDSFPIFRIFRTFNLEQCDLPQEAIDKLAERLDVIAPKRERSTIDPACDAEKAVIAYLDREGIQVTHGGSKAYYSPLQDRIGMPEKADFDSGQAYASTFAHEAAHSTGHDSRLKRGLGKADAAFGSDTYGREELVAELSSCMVLGASGVEFNQDQAVAYLRSWLRSCVNAKGDRDPSALGWASTRAYAAVDMILGNSPDEGDTPYQG